MTDSMPTRVLLVEDSHTDAKLLQLSLRQVSDQDFTITWVERVDAAIAELGKKSFDVGLLDLSLPDSTGIDTFARVQKASPQLPIVVLTGGMDGTTGTEAIRRGVQDYLVKGSADGETISRSIRYAIERKRFEVSTRLLNAELEKRVAEAQTANQSLRESQRSALNLMEDAVNARRQAERAAAELLDSELMMERAQEIAHLGSWELDLVNNRLTWSREVYRIFGLSPEEAPATYEAFLQTVHPDDRASVDSAYSGSLRDGKDSYEVEHRIVRKSTGEIRYVHQKCAHVRDESGKIVRSVGMVHDISESKQSQEAIKRHAEGLAFLSGTAARMLGPLTAPELFKLIADRIYAVADAAIVVFSEFDSANGTMCVREVRCPPEDDARAVAIFNREAPGIVVDFTETTRAFLAPGELSRVAGGLGALTSGRIPAPLVDRFTEELGIGDVYVMACAFEHDILGAVSILTRAGSEFRNKDLVESIVNQASLALKRARVEDDLRETERRFRLALANAPVSVAAQDRDLRFLWAFNQRTERPGDVIGKTDADLFAPSDAVHLMALKRRAMESGTEVRDQLWVSSNGRRMYLSLHIEPLRDVNGHITGVGVATVDLTPMKLAADRFALLTETAGELLQASESQSAVVSLCRKVLEQLDCQFFFNFLVDENAGKLHLNASAGIPDAEARRIEWIDFGTAVCGCVAQSKGRIVVEHIPSTPDPRTELVASFGVKAYACHPLLAEGGKLIGTLSFGTCTRETFSDDDLSLMKAVADQVAVAMVRMQHMQHLARVNRALTALGKSSQAMVRATDENAYVRQICRVIVEDCGYSMVWVGFAEDNEEKTVRPVAWSGFEDGYLETLNLTWSDTARGRGPTGTAIRTGEVCVCRDILVDPAFTPWRAEAIKRGYASSIAVPLGDGEKDFGALMVYSRDAHGFTADEERLFAEMAGDLAYGITALRIRASRAKVSEEIRDERNFIATVLQTTGGLIVGLDTEGRIKIFNHACEKATGYLFDEVRDRPFWDFLLAPEEMDAVQATFSALTATSLPSEIENFWVARDGSRRFIHWTNSVVLAADGAVSLVISSGMDITERRRMEAELLDSRQKLEVMVRTQSRVITNTRETLDIETRERLRVEADLSHRQQALEAVYAMATAFNSTLEAMTDQVAMSIAKILAAPFISIRYFSADAAIAGSRYCRGGLSRHMRDAAPCGAFARGVDLTSDTHLSRGITNDVQCAACFPQEKIQSYVAVPILNHQGKPCGMVCVLDKEDRVFEDYDVRLIEIFARYISHVLSQRELESQLVRSNEMRTLGQLTSGVAHEVRNPLNGILAIMGALAKEIPDTETFQPYITHMRAQVTRLTSLMEDLLALGRPIREERRVEVPMTALVGNALSSWQHSLLGKREVQFTKDGFADSDLLVRADSARIEQTIVNLLDNAHQHSAPGDRIDVAITLMGRDTVHVSVRDWGPGVPEDIMRRVFEPFFSTRKGGTGLGLSIVKQIVESHGGAIGVFNNEGAPGATFFLDLPLARPTT